MNELVRKQTVLSYIERQNKLLYDVVTPTENENNNNTYITKEFNYTLDKIYKILTVILYIYYSYVRQCYITPTEKK